MNYAGSSNEIEIAYKYYGSLDEFEIYDYSLSATEIQALMGTQPVMQVDFAAKTDLSGWENIITCAATTCSDGSSGGGAFDQASYVQSAGPQLNLSDGQFSFATWVKPLARTQPFDTDAANVFTTTASRGGDWQGLFGNETLSDADNNGTYETLNVDYPTLYVGDQGHLLMRFGHYSDTTQLANSKPPTRYSPLVRTNTWPSPLTGRNITSTAMVNW